MSELISNGQVTGRDLRQGSVRTVHVVDDAITTPKIPDLAVTFPDKIDDPFWVAVAESDLFHNVTLTTDNTLQSSATVEVPAWVDQVFVFAVGKAQMFNSSGGDQQIVIHLAFDGGEPTGAEQQTIPNGDTGSITQVQTFSTVGVAGSTFAVDIYAEVSTGTNSANNGEVNAILVGTR